jgi:hypothetical protein
MGGSPVLRLGENSAKCAHGICFHLQFMSSSKGVARVASWFGWSLGAWLGLAGWVYGLYWLMNYRISIGPWRWWLVIMMPPAAVLCGWMAVRAGATFRRWTKMIFWMVTVPGMAVCAVYLQYSYGILTEAYYRQLLLVSAVMPVLVLILAMIREARSGGLRKAGWILDMLGGTGCMVVLLVAGYFVWLKGYVEPLRQKAEARWAEIGRPMVEFEKSIRPAKENESLRALTRDLKPFGVVTLYKAGSGGGRVTEVNAMGTPKEAIEIIGAVADEKGDSIKLPAGAAAVLDSRANDFDRVYNGVLEREPVVWEMDPAVGPQVLVPNYLSERYLAQWIVADAYRRLEKGDQKRAADAVAAEMRMIQNMGKQPVLVSLMIDISIESLFAPAIARLPEGPNEMQQLAEEVDEKRAKFQETAQGDAWGLMYAFEKAHLGPDDVRSALGGAQHVFPDCLDRLLLPTYCRAVFREECSKAWLYETDVVEIAGRARELASSDLGEREMDEAAERHPSVFSPNLSRGWLRLNCALLVREQAEMIRAARSEMESGRAGKLGEHPSVVIPGAKWEMTGDAISHSVTLKLTPLPSWTGTDVAGKDFWLLPLDGSKGWKVETKGNRLYGKVE